MTFNTPVLFLIFNRPDKSAVIFDKIRSQQPKRLYIAADGPRKDKEGEKELCEYTRNAVIEKIDWDCDVKTLFRNENLGCGKAVSEAITWFFSHEEKGIILEDDCLPDGSFFEFCDLLLDKYAETKEIMCISGANILPGGWKLKGQSYFFGHGGVWGWASWRRAWDLYDYDMPAWGNATNKDAIRRAMNNDNWFDYYLGMFDATYEKKLDTWDLQWLHCIFNNGGFSINPSVNLVKNIGFGPGATHTVSTTGSYSTLATQSMKFPLKHPSKIRIDKKFLRLSFRYHFEYEKTFTRILKSWIRIYLKRLRKNLKHDPSS